MILYNLVCLQILWDYTNYKKLHFKFFVFIWTMEFVTIFLPEKADFQNGSFQGTSRSWTQIIQSCFLFCLSLELM